VLNKIFKEHGSNVDHSLMILSFGGKKHTYIQISSSFQKQLEALPGKLGNVTAGEFFETLLNDGVKVDNTVRALKNARKTATKKG
jgi:hypothetical protein